MNLLDKLTNHLKPGLAILLIPFFFACNDPTDLGLELERNDEKVIVSDTTLVLPTSTIYIDSLRTDQYNNVLFGRFYDATYGEVRAIGNHGYRLSTGIFPSSSEGDTLEFESAELRYQISSSRVKSLIGGENIKVYQSTDTIFNDAIYLANRNLTTRATPVADHTFSFDPEVDSVLNIPLQEYYGQYLFSLLSKAGSDQTFEDSLLRGQIRIDPLVLVPGDNNQALYLLDLQNDSTGIFVQMKSINNPDTSYTFLFRFNNSTRFTSIQRNRTNGELLSDLQNNYDISTAASDYVYMDMVHGVNPKINLDPLINLFNSYDHIIFNSVKFSLEAAPTESSYIDQINTLRFYFSEDDGTINATAVQNNQFQGHVLLTEASYGGGQPTLLAMAYDEESMGYSGNLTLFSQILGTTGYDNPDDLLTHDFVILSPSGLGTGRTAFLKSQVKLKIYYSTLKE